MNSFFTVSYKKNCFEQEVSAITFAQNHLKEESIAILTQTTSSTWNTDFSDDPKRADYHAEKMRSKDERPSEQLSHLRFEQTGRVYHMTLEEFQQFQERNLFLLYLQSLLITN